MTETMEEIRRDATPRSYREGECAAFRRSRDAYGDLSNMTWGFPLTVNGIRFQGPEGLYQAFKYPSRPEVQRQIAAARSGMDAKRTAYAHTPEPENWDEIRVNAMAFTLAVKLGQHPRRFGAALADTRDMDIVENSQRDPFWGARPVSKSLTGANILGRLLSALRDHLQDTGDPAEAGRRLLQGVDLSGLAINQAPVVLE